MAYELDPNEPVPDELRRVAVECLDEATACFRELDRATGDDGGPANAHVVDRLVHDIRKRCKEARAVARLVRPVVGEDAARVDELLREVARSIGPTRDVAVLRTTLRRLRPDAPEPDDSSRPGGAERVTHADQVCRLADARALVCEWEIGDDIVPLVRALAATQRRARSRRRQALDGPSDARFHAWRKAAKRLWYQLRLIEPSAPELVGPLVAELDELGELLGEDHDLAVLAERAIDEPDRYGGQEVASLARRRQHEVRQLAVAGSTCLAADDEDEFVRDVERAWRAAHRG